MRFLPVRKRQTGGNYGKYIIAVDMDGTLLNSENKISERNRNVLQRLIDDGHYVVPATGRTRELIPQEFSVLRGVNGESWKTAVLSGTTIKMR